MKTDSKNNISSSNKSNDNDFELEQKFIADIDTNSENIKEFSTSKSQNSTVDELSSNFSKLSISQDIIQPKSTLNTTYCCPGIDHIVKQLLKNLELYKSIGILHYRPTIKSCNDFFRFISNDENNELDPDYKFLMKAISLNLCYENKKYILHLQDFFKEITEHIDEILSFDEDYYPSLQYIILHICSTKKIYDNFKYISLFYTYNTQMSLDQVRFLQKQLFESEGKSLHIDKFGNNILHYFFAHETKPTLSDRALHLLFDNKKSFNNEFNKNIKKYLYEKNDNNITPYDILCANPRFAQIMEEFFTKDIDQPISIIFNEKIALSPKEKFEQIISDPKCIIPLGIIDTYKQNLENCIFIWEQKEPGSIYGVYNSLKTILDEDFDKDLNLDIIDKLYFAFYILCKDKIKMPNSTINGGYSISSDSQKVIECIYKELEEFNTEYGFYPYKILKNIRIKGHKDVLPIVMHSISEKKECLKKTIEIYHDNMMNAESSQEKMMEILFFVKHAQRIHYFEDFNGRTFYVSVLNREFIKHGLDPAFLDNPNIIDSEYNKAELLSAIATGQQNANNLLCFQCIKPFYPSTERMFQQFNQMEDFSDTDIEGKINIDTFESYAQYIADLIERGNNEMSEQNIIDSNIEFECIGSDSE